MGLSGEPRVLELIATGAPLGETLDALCRTIDEQSGLMSGIYLLSRDGLRLSYGAGPHLPPSWLELTSSFAANESGGACGCAVTRRQHVIIPDISKSSWPVEWRDAARAGGISSVWSTPFLSREGHVLGTFAMFGAQPIQPTEPQLSLVGRATYLATIAVERHLADQSLRESEQRFSTAFYSNPGCMTISRFSDDRYLYVNDAFERLSGRSRNEAVGKTADELGLYVNPPEREALMKRLRTGGRVRDIEVELRTKTGAILDVVTSFERIVVAGEDCLLSISTDITERKHAEDALRRSEERFRQVAENIREVFWLASADFNQMLYVSPGYEAVWGSTCDSLYREPRSWLSAIHVDDRARVAAVIEEQRERGFEVEYRIVRKDGMTRWIRDRGVPIRDKDGRLYRVAGIAEDITDRKEINEQLQRSEQLLRLVLDAIPVGVAVMGARGDVILNNPASTRIWSGLIRDGSERYTKTKAWWHDSGKPVKADDWASIRAVRDGETSLNEVIDIEAFDGKKKIIQNSAVPIRDSERKIVGAVVVNDDITARKAAERNLEASASEMQVLATRLLHAQDDERRRIAQMLHETTAQDLAALKMLLARLSRTSGHLAAADRGIVGDAIGLAESSMKEIRTLSYLLHPPFLDEAGLLSALRWYTDGFAARSGIKVNLELPEQFSRLPQDVETTLFRVVQEALINIHRHSGSSTADIRLSTAGGTLTLDIRDRGRGMAPGVAEAMAGGDGAFGVGIAGMRERLKQLGGRLEIESAPDHGTTIRAVVPLQGGVV